jgi:hypothetical protein
MKKLLLFALVLNLYPFLEGQAQSQTSSQKRPKFSPHSKYTRFAKPPYSWLKEMEGDSSEMAFEDEKLRSSLPPHLQEMPDLPPHILVERQWFLQNELENTSGWIQYWLEHRFRFRHDQVYTNFTSNC